MKLFNFELVRIWPPTAQNNMSREVKFCKEANIFTSWRRKRIVFCPHCARGFNFMSINCTVRRILNVSRIRKKSKSQHETSSIYFNFATAGPAFSSSSLLWKQQTLKRESLVFILTFHLCLLHISCLALHYVLDTCQ